jgi:hypothetical protein
MLYIRSAPSISYGQLNYCITTRLLSRRSTSEVFRVLLMIRLLKFTVKFWFLGQMRISEMFHVALTICSLKYYYHFGFPGLSARIIKYSDSCGGTVIDTVSIPYAVLRTALCLSLVFVEHSSSTSFSL